DEGKVRGPPRGLRLRAPAARRDRPRDRSLGGPPHPSDEHPRGHGVPEDPVGWRSDARRALATRSGPAGGARAAVRRRRRPVADAARRSGRPGRIASRGVSSADDELPWPLAPIAARPRLAALLGAVCIAFSGILYRWAEVTPSTGTVFRALFGLPLLGFVAWLEHRRYGGLPARTIRLSAIAGIFFAGDLTFWHHAIGAVGAGLATVLGNLSVLV